MDVAAAMLCAGLGTRLRPLTELLPKPLVPLGDRPLVDHAVSRLVAAGVRHFDFNAFHLPERLAAYVLRLDDGQRVFRCSVEGELLGTAGGVRGMYAGHQHVLVWNGDIHAPDLDVVELLQAGRAPWPTLVVAPVNESPVGGRGTVGVDARGRVVRLRGGLWGVEATAVDYVGIAVLPREFILRLPQRGCLVGDGLVPWLASGKRVATLEYSGFWSDGGTLLGYLQQNRDWLDRRPELQGTFVAPGVRIPHAVRLRQCVVGSGAEVMGQGELSGCVVWPGASAVAPLQNSVVLTDGRVIGVNAFAGRDAHPDVRNG